MLTYFHVHVLAILHTHCLSLPYYNKQVIAAAKGAGVYDTAVVVVWGDHGYQLGDNDQWSKVTNFEQVSSKDEFFPPFHAKSECEKICFFEFPCTYAMISDTIIGAHKAMLLAQGSSTVTLRPHTPGHSHSSDGACSRRCSGSSRVQLLRGR